MLTNVDVDAFNLYYGLGHYLSHPVRMPLAHPPSTGPHTVEVIRTEEKGSDVNLASICSSTGSGVIARRRS